MKSQTVHSEKSLESGLFVSLYRSGNLSGAKDYLKEIAARTNDAGKLIFVANNLSLIAYDEGNYTEALRVMVKVATLAEDSNDPKLKGKFHLNYARAKRAIGEREEIPSYLDQALIDYQASAFYFGQANDREQWVPLNNLALLLAKIAPDRTDESHQYLKQAGSILSKFGGDDLKARLAEVSDTQAQVFIIERDYEQAIAYAASSVQGLLKAGEPLLLSYALQTLRKAQDLFEVEANRALTEQALKDSKGSISRAAKILRISRQGMDERVKRIYPELEIYAHRGKPRGVHA